MSTGQYVLIDDRWAIQARVLTYKSCKRILMQIKEVEFLVSLTRQRPEGAAPAETAGRRFQQKLE